MKSMLKLLWKDVTMVHETLSHYLPQRNGNGQESENQDLGDAR